MSIRSRSLTIVLVMTLCFTYAAGAQEDLAGEIPDLETTTSLRLRSGPGEDFAEIIMLPPRTPLRTEGPIQGNLWMPVHTVAQVEDAPPGTSGWVSICCIAASAEAAEITERASNTGVVIARTATGVNLRTGPGEEYEVIEVLPRGVNLALDGGMQGFWVPVRVANTGQTGWVARQLIEMSAGLPEERISPEVDFSPELAAYGEELMLELARVPIVPDAPSARTYEIFARGQALGNNPQVVTKAGDCNSASGAFLTLMGQGRVNLGEYGHLGGALGYYGGSMARDSVAAHAGFTALSVLDPMLANPNYCQAGQSSLVCEFQRARPSVVFVMFGSGDIHHLDVNQYRDAMRSVVEASIENGVIPVLMTVPNNPTRNALWLKILEFNVAVLQVAREYDVPIANLWLATQYLPQGGVDDDLLHLSYGGGDWLTFNGDQNIWGYTRANLVALQMLDVLWRGLPLP